MFSQDLVRGVCFVLVVNTHVPVLSLVLSGDALQPLMSEFFEVPFRTPQPFPFATVHAMRFLFALAASDDRAVLGEVTEAIWVSAVAQSTPMLPGV